MRALLGTTLIALASLATTCAHAATVSFFRTTGPPSAAAIAAGVPFDEIINKYFLTTDADIVSFNRVTTRLNKFASPLNFGPPLDSDTEPPNPASIPGRPGLEADSWITTPGPTLRTVFSDQGTFPGSDTWSDTTNDGPQTNFQFAQYTIPIEVNGFLEGSITLAGANGPETKPFSLHINFPFGVPEPSALALVSMGLIGLAIVRHRRPASVTSDFRCKSPHQNPRLPQGFHLKTPTRCRIQSIREHQPALLH